MTGEEHYAEAERQIEMARATASELKVAPTSFAPGPVL
jgi:hypothetical protein